jgi:hypothetical protein
MRAIDSTTGVFQSRDLSLDIPIRPQALKELHWEKSIRLADKILYLCQDAWNGTVLSIPIQKSNKMASPCTVSIYDASESEIPLFILIIQGNVDEAILKVDLQDYVQDLATFKIMVSQPTNGLLTQIAQAVYSNRQRMWGKVWNGIILE